MVAPGVFFGGSDYLSWATNPEDVLELLALSAFLMLFLGMLFFRVPLSPKAFAATLATFFLLVSTITVVRYDALPLVVPESQYEYGMELVHLPLGFGSFIGLIRPEHSWSLLLCPLTMLVTGCVSRESAAPFFPFAFVRCLQLTHFVLVCICSVYLQVKGGGGGYGGKRA